MFIDFNTIIKESFKYNCLLFSKNNKPFPDVDHISDFWEPRVQPKKPPDLFWPSKHRIWYLRYIGRKPLHKKNDTFREALKGWCYAFSEINNTYHLSRSFLIHFTIKFILVFYRSLEQLPVLSMADSGPWWKTKNPPYGDTVFHKLAMAVGKNLPP